MAVSTTGKAIWRVAIVFVICMLVFALSGQRINLIADGQVNFSDKPSDWQVVKVLRPGEIFPVERCEDLKHYLTPVVLIDGKWAYVHNKNCRLERKSIWELNAGPVSFSCP